MTRLPYSPLIAILLLGGLSPGSRSQTWTEVYYNETTITYLDQNLQTLNITASGQLTFGAGVDNYFLVSGDATQAPSWRTRFETLCENTCLASQEWSPFLTAPGQVKIYEDYYTRVGREEFSNGSTLVARDLWERVTSRFFYTVSGGSGGGEGGGS